MLRPSAILKTRVVFFFHKEALAAACNNFVSRKALSFLNVLASYIYMKEHFNLTLTLTNRHMMLKIIVIIPMNSEDWK
ncbi:hypothetical protein HNR44_000290 [Geomicrobium halophilum]|uniref:Uncharacterized protein n=1 Tax=Geomicrobium halophilum TaxID=549000 RepID=A0A841PPW3_9BACL|nr:hypothetical protein [Geomicrobium halophilum]